MKALILLLMVVLLYFSSCTTHLQVQGHPGANIYVNNTLSGRGTINLPRLGIPKRVQITAYEGSQKIAEQEIRRRFTFGTLMLGLSTYYTGFIWGWAYPANISIHSNYKVQSWDSPPTQSRWDNPKQ